MRPLKIAILGNCQARPIAAILSTNTQSHSISYVGIVHLLKEHDRQDFFQAMENADLIITQNIADNYPCEFVRTSSLAKLFPEKVIRIANLYFRGYNPELRYIRNGKLGTLRGPLGDYHISTILLTWLEGGSKKQILDRLHDHQWNLESYGNVAQASLTELRSRDEELDAPAAALIEERWQNQLLFFTFNHPSMQLLTEYCNTIAKQVSARFSLPGATQSTEPLGQFQLPLNPILKSSIPSHSAILYRGVEVSSINQWVVTTGKKTSWSEDELVDEYISIYEENADVLHEQQIAA